MASSSTPVNYPNASEFAGLSERAQNSTPLMEGEWIYAVCEPEHYAVVLGHADSTAVSLHVPDLLGGADVVAVADGAFADHKALQSITLPGNVYAVGSEAIPAGVLVRGYHGTYAHVYALERGYAFQSVSEFDFAQGVVDYGDIRTEAFVRHSAYNLTLRKLEASRLQTGSVFFLIDPRNAYQISYYRVVSMEDHGNGFVSIACETPVMDDVLRSFHGTNEKMVLDVSTLKLNEGVTYRAPRGVSGPDSVDLDLNFDFKVGKCDVTMRGGYSATFKVPEYEGNEDSEKKSATMELTENLHGTVTVKTGLNAADDMLDLDSLKDLKNVATDIGEYAGKLQNMVSAPYSYPLGVGCAFSYAGLVTVEAHFCAEFEISGEGSVDIVYETVTTYSGDTDGNSTKKTVVENKSITPEGKIKIRAGVKAEANLYLTAVCVFQVSGFAGTEITLSYRPVEWDLEDGTLEVGINMIDCVRLEAHFIVEVGIRAGLLKVFHYDVPLEVSLKADFKIVDITLVDKHFHLMPVVLHMELPSGEITNSGLAKDIKHDSEDCPYGNASLEVRLSRKIGNQKALLMEFEKIDAGFTVTEPEDPTEAYEEYKISGWFSSTKPTQADRVSFPYVIKEGNNVLYGNVLKKEYVHFIYEDGTEIAEPQYLFPGDLIQLPETDPERVILKWAQVESPAFLVERETVQIEPGSTEVVMPVVTGDVYLCAFEAPEINVNFYESVNGAPMYKIGSVKSKAGQLVQKPEDTEMCERFEDCGWQEVMGEEFTFPFTVPEGKIVDVSLVHFLGMKPSDDDFTWMSGEYPGSAYPSQSAKCTYRVEEDANGIKYAVITGYKEVDENGNIDLLRNLRIPSYIDGYQVRGIATNAFNSNTTIEAVTLASGIDFIGSGAFYNCPNLRMVDLTAEKLLLDIGGSAFEDCINLTDLRVDEDAFITYGQESFKKSGIVSVYASRGVGRSAFEGCTNLQKVTVPSFCVTIGWDAFADCTRLREIDIAEGLDSIEMQAFKGCTSLLELEIPSGVSCSRNLVEGCTGLEKLIVHDTPEPTEFLIVPPVYYYDTPTDLLSLKHLEIGEGYTSIGQNAFENLHQLETLILPDSMETIGDRAFYGTSVSSVTLTNAKNIGESAFASNPCLKTVDVTTDAMESGVFENCPALQSITLGGIKEIPDHTFSGCYSVEEVHLPENTLSLGNGSFAGCEKLQELDLPQTLKTIGAYAFQNCFSLEAIDMPEGLKTVKNYAFQNCSSLTEMIFPDSVTCYGNDSLNAGPLIDGCSSLTKLYIGSGYANAGIDHNNALYADTSFIIGPENNIEYVEFGEGITAIHEPFDEYYTNVKTLILPSSLTTIGCDFCTDTFAHFGMRTVSIKGDIDFIASDAFRYCENLETVEVEGENVSIGSYAFADTPELKTVVFEGVESIRDNAFQNSGIESISIGDGIRTIEKTIFDQCSSLHTIRIADSLESIRLNTLGACPALEELYIGGLKEIKNMVYAGDPRVLEFGQGVESIYVKPVASLTNLERLVLPEGLISIRRMDGIGKNLRELILPQTLQTIESYAFDNGQFETVEIPANVNFIGSQAFSNNPNLKRVVIHGDEVEIDGFAFYNCPSLEEVVIHGSIKSVGDSAFWQTAIESLEFPDGLESVGEYAFRDMKNLKRLVLPNTLQTMGYHILYDSNNVEYLAIGGLETIPAAVFGGNGEHKLQCLVLGEGVKYIGYHAFETDSDESFPYLETIVFPDSLEELAEYAFYGSAVRNVVLDGGNLRKIGSSAFANCTQLESVVIDSSYDVDLGSAVFSNCVALERVQLHDLMTEIAGSTFSGCMALEEIDLPKNLQTIGSSAFADCSSLRRIDLPNGLKEIGGQAFKNNASLTSISIPDSVTTMSGYRAFDGCSNVKRMRISSNIDLSTMGGSTIMAGLPDDMEYLEFGEGITAMQTFVFNFDQYSNSFINTVVLPESMTTIKESMLRLFYGASYVKFSSSVTTLVPYDGYSYYDKDLVNTTFYTERYNEVVASAAEKLGAFYSSLDGMTECQVQLHVSLNGVAGADAFDTLKGDLFSGITLPNAPSMDGYRFAGWYYDEACTMPVRDGERFTGDMSLYASFIANDVTIYALKMPRSAQLEGTFENAMLPEGFVEYAKHSQVADASTKLPANPVLEGYSFTGWHIDPALYIPFENAVVERHPAVLYGGFTTAAQGGMLKNGILSNYMPTEMDGASIVLPDQIGGTVVRGIAAHTFSGLDMIQLTLPEGLSEVDSEAFHGAKSLRRILISAANENFSTRNGVLYNKDYTVLIRYPEGIRTSSFTVPDTVLSIAPRAFENCSYLQQIVLPEGLESIGASAFAHSGLKSVSLPGSVTYLGEKAFEACTQMTSFAAYGLETIGSNALPASVSLAVRGPLLEGALRDAAVNAGSMNLRYNIRYLSVWNGDDEMAAYSLEAGTPLPGYIQGGSVGVDQIVYALYQDAALTQPCELSTMPDEDVNLYAEIRPVFVTQSITLESGVTGYVITSYNGNGGEVIIPRAVNGVDVVALGEGMLVSARGNVTSIDIGSEVVSIADSALNGANGAAFAGTVYADADSYAALWAQEKGLRTAMSVYTLSFNSMGGSSIASVQAAKGALLRLTEPARTGYTFDGWYLDAACQTSVEMDESGLYAMPGENTTLYAAWIDSEEDGIDFTFVQTDEGMTITGYTGSESSVKIPASINQLPVTAIAERAFADVTTVTSVELPETLVSIGSNAFARMTRLSSITIPESVTSIGYAAFRDCSSLQTVHIGSGLQSLGEQAFRGAKSLAGFTVSDGGWFTQAGGVLYTDGGQSLVCCPAGFKGELSVLQGVTYLYPYAIAESGITSIVIPDSLEMMGEAALFNCDSLTEFVIGDGAAMLYLPDRMLSDADTLRTVRLGSRVWGVGASAFFGCDALTAAYVAPEVEMISDMAFAGANKQFVITGQRGSAAHSYAQRNGFGFVSEDQDGVEELLFETESVTLVIGQQAVLNVRARPQLPEGETLYWTSSNPEVAYVSIDGEVRALVRGNAVITVSSTNGVKAEMTVTVKGTPAETLKLVPEELYVCVGSQKELTTLITPAWADTTCEWFSDDEKIAAVDQNGLVTGISEGETIIRAKTESGCVAEVKVSSYKPVEEIRLTEEITSLTLNVIDQPTVQLSAVAYPEDATYRDLIFQSDDEEVVTVTADGLITVCGAGEASVTITALYASDEPVILTIPVEVVPYDISGEAPPEIAPMAYKGYTLTPTLAFVIGDYSLEKYYDYSFQNHGTAELGEHSYTLTGIGLFTGTLTGTYEIVEFQATAAYTGKPVLEAGATSLSYTSNVPSKLKFAYALQSDPQNWIDGKPTEVGDYLLRLYIPDEYGVIGCEDVTELRIVDSFIKEMVASANTIHLYGGQSVNVKIDFVLEEGVASLNPTIKASKEDPNAILNSAYMRTSSGVRQLYLSTSKTAEGEAEITVYRSGKTTDEVRIKVHVHQNPSTMKLPKITKVEEEAFMNVAANVIRLEGKNVTIGARAFKDSASLWQVVVSKDAAAIAPDALESTGAVVVCSSFTSQAAMAAEEYGLAYVVGY